MASAPHLSTPRPSLPAILLLWVVTTTLSLLSTSALSDDGQSTDSGDGFVDLLADDQVKLWQADGKTEQARSSQWSRWTFSENNLHCEGKQYGFIHYDQEVSDFILRLEFRLATAGGNSGIGIRGLPYREHSTRPSVVAYELQILDDRGKQPSKRGNMSLYHHREALDNSILPPGEWNRLQLTCRGPRITVTLNGKKVQDIDQSKYDRLKDKPLSGYLLLQNHSNPIDFRNIHLKHLPADENAQ